METKPKTKTNKGTKLGVLGFIVFCVLTLVYTAYRAKKTDFKTDSVKTQIDSLESKVDSRYYAYDNLFFSTNSIVIDSLGNKIGEVYILTNDEAIEEFYNDSTRQKTKYYYNLKDRIVKIKDK